MSAVATWTTLPPASGPSAAEVDRLRRWLVAVSQRATRMETGGITYLVVSPLGMAERTALRRLLADLDVAPPFARVVVRWPDLATALYVKRLDGGALRRALLYERAWRARFPGAPAEAWALPPGVHAQVDAVKRALRAGLRHLRVDLGAGAGTAVLHPFHLADPADAALEARRLVAVCGVSAPAVPSAVGPLRRAAPGRDRARGARDRVEPDGRGRGVLVARAPETWPGRAGDA